MSDSAVKEKPSTGRRDQWRERIAEQARSGLSVQQFCKDRGIAEHAFYYWRKRLQDAEPVRFALVDRTGGAGATEWNLELTLRTVLEAPRA